MIWELHIFATRCWIVDISTLGARDLPRVGLLRLLLKNIYLLCSHFLIIFSALFAYEDGISS
jgi:hypothetical protein